VEAPLAARLNGAALVFLRRHALARERDDRAGLDEQDRRAHRHVNLSGPDGSIAAFSTLNVGRKIFVHINNSNPVLNAASKERLRPMPRLEIGEDGMEVAL